jgi:hypothetical protein
VHVVGAYLDDALADFSGTIAVDELYDGPFYVLSIVDNYRFRRLIYEVLDRQAPPHACRKEDPENHPPRPATSAHLAEHHG